MNTKKSADIIEPSWRKDALFIYMKELTDKNYSVMIKYEKSGGELTEDDLIARRHYEKYYKNRRKRNDSINESNINMQ